MEICTIGYEGLSLPQFLGFLRQNGVRHLIDIREAPISRKAGFAKAALAEALSAAGIRYTHLRALGCPKPIRDRHRASGDDERYRRDFGIYLAAQGAALEEVRRASGAAPTCLMCFEADPARCHRSLVAEALRAPDLTVRHIKVRPPSPQTELDFG
ncbi:MAG TPA: DUF488 domain-containing protein [Steroidobacteraceae bacterium]|nr:DUF488 domain-containing protein [Steroidobacteraceae bacterium]